MYFSAHQYPFYPGTGSAAETGEGEGEGFTVNVPLAGGTTGGEYLARFYEVMEARIRAFAPDFVMMSAGFDGHQRDPLTSLALDDEMYRTVTTEMVKLAGETAGGRVLSVLEGGYNLQVMPALVEEHLLALGGGTL